MLLLIGLVSLLMALALPRVRIDFEFERFFATDDPELARYHAFRERFGHDNEFMLVSVQRDSGVYDHRFLGRVDALRAALAAIPDVRSVVAATSLEEPVITPLGAFQVPYLRFATAEHLTTDSARISADPRVAGVLVSNDAKALLMVANTRPGLSKVASDTLLARVDRAIAASGLDRVHTAGRVHAQYHYIRMMQHELVLFLCIAAALLAVFLWAGFRSAWGVLVPMTIVGLAVLWQVGLMALLGRPLGILTMLLPTILFVVGMSDVVHILECYLDEVRAGRSRVEAIRNTYREVGLPTLITALTAAIGFATLGTASIRPLQEFGWTTAIGVLITFLISFTLLPALLLLVKPARLLPRSNEASPWDRQLHRLFAWTIRRRTAVLTGFALLTVGGLIGMGRMQVDNHLLDDWSEAEQERLGYRFLDRQFGGVRPFEMEVTVVDSGRTIWDPAILRDIERVQDTIEARYDLRAVRSPVTVMRSLNKAFNGGQADHYILPGDDATIGRLARRAHLLGKESLHTIVAPDARSARISGRMVDRGGRWCLEQERALQRSIAAGTDTTAVRFHETGMAHLIDRSNATLSRQLMRGMGLAVLLTALLMMWAFRDLRMVVVAIVPNLVPLVFTAGLMGWWGIHLNVSTAIIFSIAFGIAEDDTIHMLARLRHEMRRGLSPLAALKRTYLSTGKAVVLTSLMLLSGFVTLTLSDFGSVHRLGLLVTLTLLFAFVAELLLLPVLVMLMPPRSPVRRP